MNELPEYIDHLPNLCGEEQGLDSVIQSNRAKPVYAPENRVDFGRIRSACAIALHMHQPLILAILDFHELDLSNRSSRHPSGLPDQRPNSGVLR
jgi:hypothetical protein